MVDAIWLSGCCGLRQGPWLGVGGRWALRDLDPVISYKSVHAVILLPSGVASYRFIAARRHMTQLVLGPGLDCSALRCIVRARLELLLIASSPPGAT